MLPSTRITDFSNKLLLVPNEKSFVHSICEGINSNRKKLLYFSEPDDETKSHYNSGASFMYNAVLYSLGISYESAMLIIQFLNAMSTVVAAYTFFSFGKTRLIECLFYFFNFSIILAKILFDSKFEDRLEAIEANVDRVSLPIIPFMFLFSSEISISIPMAIFAITFGASSDTSRDEIINIAILVGILIPNSMISICVFLSLIYAPQRKKFIIPAIVPVLRALRSPFTFSPIWKSFSILEMIFCVPFINIVGFLLVLIIPVALYENITLIREKAMMCFPPLIFCTLFTQNNSNYVRIASMLSVVSPPLIFSTHHYLQQLVKKKSSVTHFSFNNNICNLNIYLFVFAGILTIFEMISIFKAT